MSGSSSDEETSTRTKKGPKKLTDVQRQTIEKLMSDPVSFFLKIKSFLFF